MIVRRKNFVAGRVKRLRQLMVEHSLDGLLVTDPAEVFYLTGFSGDDSILVLTNQQKVLVTDSRYVEQVRQECPSLAMKVRQGAMDEAVGQVVNAVMKKRHRTGKTKHAGKIGIDPQTVTLSQYRRLQRVLGRTLQESKGLVGELRLRKDSFEINQILRAVRVAEGSMKALLGEIRLGQSERDLVGRLEYQMSQRCSDKPAFDTIAAFGGHAAQPHARPGNNRLRKGQTILFDWGATVGGYRSDLTRCWAAGKIPPIFAEAYQRVLEAQHAAIERVKPGVLLTEVDEAARKIFKRSRWMYQHGTGHGLGMKVHEEPVISRQSQGQLQEGMVVTIEPGWYQAGKFGIRIEDDVLVTTRGARVLSCLAKELESVRLWQG